MHADYHVHSSYSDGTVLPKMVEAADAAGIEAVGFADHCNLSRERRTEKLLFDRNFDRTYERRREAIEILRERQDVEIYDAVEVDYEPAREAAIGDFLETAGFDYALGSVHYVDDYEVLPRQSYDDVGRETRDRVVDRYYETVVSLIDSELFDVAAHVDLVEAHPDLEGHTTDDHRHQVAAAFAESRTIPEINASHAADYGTVDCFHPSQRFVEVLQDQGVRFTVGTDSHEPGDFARRLSPLSDFLDDRGIKPFAPPSLAE